MNDRHSTEFKRYYNRPPTVAQVTRSNVQLFDAMRRQLPACTCENDPKAQPCVTCRERARVRFMELKYGRCTCKPDGNMCSYCKTWSEVYL